METADPRSKRKTSRGCGRTKEGKVDDGEYLFMCGTKDLQCCGSDGQGATTGMLYLRG